MQADYIEISLIPEIGEIIAKSVEEFFSQDQTKDLIAKLKTSGVNMIQEEDIIDERFLRKNFCAYRNT